MKSRFTTLVLLALLGPAVSARGALVITPSEATLNAGDSIVLRATLDGAPRDSEWTIPSAGSDKFNFVGGLGTFPFGIEPSLAGGTEVTYLAPTVPFPLIVFVVANDLRGNFGTTRLVINPPAGRPAGMIAYTVGAHLMQVDIGSGATRLINGTGYDPAWRDGLYLFTQSGRNDPGPSLYRLDAVNGVVEWLHRDAIAFAFDFTHPRISPTGEFVSYFQFGSDPLGLSPTSWNCYVITNDAAANLSRISLIFPGLDSPNWFPPSPNAPRGRLMMVNNTAAALLPDGIYVTDGTFLSFRPVLWTNGVYGIPVQAVPSPDGTRVAVATGNGNLYVADYDGTNDTFGTIRLIRANSGGRVASRPEWSPDGKWIAYLYSGSSLAIRTLFIRRPDGTGPVFHVPVDISTVGGPLISPVGFSSGNQFVWQTSTPPPAPVFRLAVEKQPSGAMRLTLSGPPGNYAMQQSTNLVTWTDKYPITIDASGVATLTDTDGPQNNSVLFYRARTNGSEMAANSPTTVAQP